MTTKKICILLILILPINIFAQKKQERNTYKSSIQKFYDILYEKKKIEFSEFYGGPGKIKNEDLEENFSDLTFGVSYDSINKVIERFIIHDEGYGYSEYAILKFGNNKEIFFLIDVDSFIVRIWLSNGEELYDKIKYNGTSSETLLWKGISSPSLSYVELHEKPELNSKVTKKILPNQIFYFIPIGENWWPVYENGKTFLGYIQKKDVVTYQNFPKELKIKVKTGC